MRHFKTLQKAEFEDYHSGFLKAEVSKDRRPTQADDIVTFQEVNGEAFTGREFEAQIALVTKPKGLLKDFILIQYASASIMTETALPIAAAPVPDLTEINSTLAEDAAADILTF